MDEEECYRWGEIFAGPWESPVGRMSDRAEAMELVQETSDSRLIWRKDPSEECR